MEAPAMKTISFTSNQPTNEQPHLQQLAQTVLKAKRIAVVCGAGISCASGIPDFRSQDGLFETLKKQHPQARLSSGKDLFDASLFSSESNAAIFYSMIAELKSMADKATPTPFHQLLKTLDNQGKLFRVYTQNIDGLEERVGLSYGLGPPSLPSRRSLAPSPSNSTMATPSSSPGPPSLVIPRCIPLHGHLGTLSCPCCSHTLPLSPHLDLLSSGTTPSCPQCLTIDAARASLGERSRGVGRMKPDVVLYGETHKEGERVGEITRRDLLGVRPDLLIVVGTSLKVPGTKLLVRELSRVIRPLRSKGKKVGEGNDGEEGDGEDNANAAKEEEAEEEDEEEMPVASGSTNASSVAMTNPGSQQQAPTTKPRAPRKKVVKPDPIHTVYLNLEFPTPAKEWKETFDMWAQGDIQEFVEIVEREREAEEERALGREREKREKEERKVEREKKRAEKEKLEKTMVKTKTTTTTEEKGKKVKTETGAEKKELVKPKKEVKNVKPPPPTKTKQGALGFQIVVKTPSTSSSSSSSSTKSSKALLTNKKESKPATTKALLPTKPVALSSLPVRITRSSPPLSMSSVSSLTSLESSSLSELSDVSMESVASRTRGSRSASSVESVSVSVSATKKRKRIVKEVEEKEGSKRGTNRVTRGGGLGFAVSKAAVANGSGNRKAR